MDSFIVNIIIGVGISKSKNTPDTEKISFFLGMHYVLFRHWHILCTSAVITLHYVDYSCIYVFLSFVYYVLCRYLYTPLKNYANYSKIIISFLLLNLSSGNVFLSQYVSQKKKNATIMEKNHGTRSRNTSRFILFI